MKPSDELHQLVKNLSMSEKRYFKIVSSMHVIGGQNNYIRLFEAIEKQEVYDEQKIKTTFAKETFVSHLPSEKHYLYNHILDSLNLFHKDRTFLTRYANIIVTIEILFNKGLFEQCKRVIKKAKAEAYSLEKFSILNLIIRWETLVFIKDEDVKNLYKSFDEEFRILEVIRIQSALMRIAFRIQIEIYKGNVSSTFYSSQEQEIKKIFPPPKEVNSFWAKYYYFSGMGLIYSMRNMKIQQYKCYKEINALMQNASQFIVDLPRIYHINNDNLVNLMFVLGKNDEAKTLIQHQRTFMQMYRIKNPALVNVIFLNTNESELYLFYKTEQYEKGLELVKKIEPELKKISILFSPIIFDLLFIMAVIGLCAQDYKSSVKWLNMILNSEKEMNIRMELRINARLLYLIVLYEKEDLFFDNQYNSVKRFMAQESGYKKQSIILEIIHLFSDEKPSERKKSKARQLYKLIKAKRKKLGADAIDKQFDFERWIEEMFIHKKW